MTNTIKPGDTVYLVKYALSGDIRKGVVECISSRGTNLYLTGMRGGGYTIGNEAFADKAEAERFADGMRVKKIASLRKQIAKLEKMDFTEIKESKDG